MKKVIVNISWSDKNYCASAEINGIVIATNKSYKKLKVDFESAFKFHVEGSLQDSDELPEYIVSGAYEFEYIDEISALLHRLDGIVTRSAIANATGINAKQIGHYAMGLHNPRPAQRERIVAGIRDIGRNLISVV